MKLEVYEIIFLIGIIVTAILIILSLLKDRKGIIQRVKFFFLLPTALPFIYYLIKILLNKFSLIEYIFFAEYLFFSLIDSLLFFCNRKWAIVIGIISAIIIVTAIII